MADLLLTISAENDIAWETVIDEEHRDRLTWGALDPELAGQANIDDALDDLRFLLQDARQEDAPGAAVRCMEYLCALWPFVMEGEKHRQALAIMQAFIRRWAGKHFDRDDETLLDGLYWTMRKVREDLIDFC